MARSVLTDTESIATVINIIYRMAIQVYFCRLCEKDLSNVKLKTRMTHLKSCSKTIASKGVKSRYFTDSPDPKATRTSTTTTTTTTTSAMHSRQFLGGLNSVSPFRASPNDSDSRLCCVIDILWFYFVINHRILSLIVQSPVLEISPDSEYQSTQLKSRSTKPSICSFQRYKIVEEMIY